MQVSEKRSLADFLPTLIIKAKDFAAELTGHNVTDKDLRGEVNISKEHIDNNKAVRDMLFKRGVKPEHLPPAEDLKKLQRRLNADDKKVMKDGGKRRGNEFHFKSNCDYQLLIILLTLKVLMQKIPVILYYALIMASDS